MTRFDEAARKLPYKPRRRRTLASRLWARVDKSGGPDACWPWLGSHTKDGYGTIWSGGNKREGARQTLTHRVAWALEHDKPVPPGLMVRHDCDNPPCCNPKHLRLGTQSSNMLDMWNRLRNKNGPAR